MKRKSFLFPTALTLFAGALLAAAGTAGCGSSGDTTASNSDPNQGGSGGGGSDLDASTDSSYVPDGAGGGDSTIVTPPDSGPNACGNDHPNCYSDSIGPSGNPPRGFPMPGDEPSPDNVTADGVTRDNNGYLSLDSSKAQFDFLWVANDMNYGSGTVSKIRTTPFPSAPTYREAARYPTITCQSNPTGSKEGITFSINPGRPLCTDGVNGCCSRAEVNPGASGGHQPVQTLANRPSRTAVDVNGDVWVANRAFGGQSSVTKIANSIRDCIDRNGNGIIDTSSDVNSDGIITTDCDENNTPDDGSTVCNAGLSHEFFGLDDECILFTVNTGPTNVYGRPLALGPGDQGSSGYGPSDAWAGTWVDGVFYRVDGRTGAIKTTVALQGQSGVTPHPYGAAIDKYGILWAPNEAEHALFYFDTNNPSNQGMVSCPLGGGGFYGIAVDGYSVPDSTTGQPVMIQQVWLGEVSGSGAYRYRPLRDGTFAGLGQGTWSHVHFDGGVTQGRGIGVDNRSPVSFAWVALDSGAIGRIPTNVADGEVGLDASQNTFSTSQGGTLGAGVAFDLDVWGINQGSSSAVHFKVDASGAVAGGPDVVPLDDKASAPESFCGQDSCKPHPYTYSDFTGFGLRNFTNPHGIYSWIQPGCTEGKTRWHSVIWDADLPAGTSITMRARSASSRPALAAATWTEAYEHSPADLAVAPGPLVPNPAEVMEVLFELTTTNDVSPKLKSFQIVRECIIDTPTPQ